MVAPARAVLVWNLPSRKERAECERLEGGGRVWSHSIVEIRVPKISKVPRRRKWRLPITDSDEPQSMIRTF